MALVKTLVRFHTLGLGPDRLGGEYLGYPVQTQGVTSPYRVRCTGRGSRPNPSPTSPSQVRGSEPRMGTSVAPNVFLLLDAFLLLAFFRDLLSESKLVLAYLVLAVLVLLALAAMALALVV